MENEKYEIVIGLEVHAQVLTKSKLFSGDAVNFGAAPNTNVSPVSLAHPGTLPVLNKEAVHLAVRLGIAMNCSITTTNYFARKNYFYPDLPKGYQVSQHTAPICGGGYMMLNADGKEKKVRLNRIHIEEDAGKSLHDQHESLSYIDLNRAGTALLEIVTEPDLRSADEAYTFLTELRKLVRWLDVCDGNMEEGSLRCDANVSVRLSGEKELGKRVEIKNLNSIRNVRKAITIEAERLIQLCESGREIKQETRSFDADNNITFSLRSKEEADDYRYFPEPDLPPVFISADRIAEIKNQMPELPSVLKIKYINEYGLSESDAEMLTGDRSEHLFFEALVKNNVKAKSAANWINGPLRNYSNEHNISLSNFPLSTEQLASLITLSDNGIVHFNAASTKLMEALVKDPSADPLTVARSMSILQEKNYDALSEWVDNAIASMPEKVAEYKSGKKGLIGVFAGNVKKLSGGKADMQAVVAMLEERLKN